MSSYSSFASSKYSCLSAPSSDPQGARFGLKIGGGTPTQGTRQRIRARVSTGTEDLLYVNSSSDYITGVFYFSGYHYTFSEMMSPSPTTYLKKEGV